MGTDGLWDLISNQEAVDLVLGWMGDETLEDENYAQLLAEEAYRRYIKKTFSHMCAQRHAYIII
jgi:hypothetical protein